MNNNNTKTNGSLGNRDERVLLRLRLRLFPLKVVSFSKKRRTIIKNDVDDDEIIIIEKIFKE